MNDILKKIKYKDIYSHLLNVIKESICENDQHILSYFVNFISDSEYFDSVKKRLYH